MQSVDLATGKTNWAVDVKGEVESRPAYHNGIVYFSVEESLTLFAMNAATGDVIWQCVWFFIVCSLFLAPSFLLYAPHMRSLHASAPCQLAGYLHGTHDTHGYLHGTHDTHGYLHGTHDTQCNERVCKTMLLQPATRVMIRLHPSATCYSCND